VGHPEKKHILSGSTASTPSPATTCLLSPTRKPMGAKNRISLQFPQCTSLQREEPSLSNESVSMSLSSASGSWVSSATSKKPDNKGDDLLSPTAPRHPLLGHNSLAQGRGRHHYSAPGHGCAWANFPLGNAANKAHYKKSSKGVEGMTNRAGAWGGKCDNQEGCQHLWCRNVSSLHILEQL
jgi:hypothetical protein